MKKSYLKGVAETLNLVRIKETPLIWKWANENYYLTPMSSGVPGRWECYPYQEGILSMMRSDEIEWVVVKKPRRVGFTKMVSALYCYFVAVLQRGMCVYHPTDFDSKTYVKDEIEPLFQYIPTLSESLSCDWKKKHPNNGYDRKEFRGCVVHFRGAQAEQNFRQITVPAVFLDEVDAMPVTLDGGASLLDSAWGRTEASVYRKIIIGSTPRVKDASNVDRAFSSVNVVMKRFVKCLKCGELLVLEWDNFFYKKSEDGTCATDAWFACQKCKHEARYDEYPDMDAAGVWMSPDLKFRYDQNEECFFHCDTGERAFGLMKVGIDFWSAYSYEMTWKTLASTWISAYNSSLSGDESGVVAFTNQLRATAWEEKSRAKISHEGIAMRAEKYSPQSIPAAVQFLTAGIDVQTGNKERSEISIWGFGDNESMFLIDHIIIDGDIADPVVAGSLTAIMAEHYKRADGKNLRISVICVDSGDGNKTSDVYRFVSAHSSWATMGDDSQRRIVRAIKGGSSGEMVRGGKTVGDHVTKTVCKMHLLNTVTLKDIFYRKLRETDSSKPGFIHFPVHIAQSVPNYYRQLTSERRVVSRSGGKVSVKYVPDKPDARNEALDCAGYAMAAYVIAKNIGLR